MSRLTVETTCICKFYSKLADLGMRMFCADLPTPLLSGGGGGGGGNHKGSLAQLRVRTQEARHVEHAAEQLAEAMHMRGICQLLRREVALFETPIAGQARN
jgi:hypothetical protein